MEQNNDSNHLYTLIKHCNEFLYRRDDYRIPSYSQSDHSSKAVSYTHLRAHET